MGFENDKTRPRTDDKSRLPPNLSKFMLRHWDPGVREAPEPIPLAKNHAARRKQLSRRFPGEVLIVPTGHAKVRANDTFYPFRPGTDCHYLTGVWEPDCVLVSTPSRVGHDHILFVVPNAGKRDAAFFTDRVKGELWEGPRPGVAESQAAYGIRCKALVELPATIAAAAASGAPVRMLRGVSEQVERRWRSDTEESATRDRELAEFLAEMRLIKDADEIRALQSAVRATHRGFEEVIARLPHARSERELEGVFWTRARIDGNDVGYTSIVAAGNHACTLHWKKNDGMLRKGELLLLDAGVEGRSLYTADVTRTLPISGKFSAAQRAVYDIVLSAQLAALECVKPGNDFMAPNQAAMVVLAQGLERLGILPTSARESLREENQFHRRYTLHNVSHMLGLDVHDCAKARTETYQYGNLREGMVLTVEPGLYFQPDDLTVPTRYRGIGVRIEDDVVVTARGHRVLSASIPKETDAVEAWMRKIWRRR